MDITKIFYQSWDTELPKVIMIRNNQNIPKDFEYKRFTIGEIEAYLMDKWPHVMPTFNSYKLIQHKVDLWRYCILYDTGGVYMDADCILMDNFTCLLQSNCFFVCNDRGIKNIFNGFLGTYPKNPIYMKIINFLLNTQIVEDYYFNCKELYNIITEYVPITINVYEYTYNSINIYILWDTLKHDHRFYPYFHDKCILVETNPFYPYTPKIIKNTKYKINKYDGDKYKEYPNIWKATFITAGQTTLENVELPDIIINSISSWRLSII